MKRNIFLFLLCSLLSTVMLFGCSLQPCAYVAVGEKICLATLPVTPEFTQRQELVIAQSARGPLTALAQTQWTAQQYASVVTTALGQRLYELRYDGHTLHFERGDFPLPLVPENIMLDTQLMWWPLAMLQAQLPAAARLQETTENRQRVRELYWRDQKRIRIVYTDAGISFEQLAVPYQILVKELPNE